MFNADDWLRVLDLTIWRSWPATLFYLVSFFPSCYYDVIMNVAEFIAKINVSIQDSLSEIRVVKSFANEDAEHNKFRGCNEAYLDLKTDSYKIMGAFHAGNSFFQGLLYAAVLTSGGYFITQGKMPPADIGIVQQDLYMFVGTIGENTELLRADGAYAYYYHLQFGGW